MNAAEHFDTIVVGGGAVGASTLFHLATAGVTRTLLLEQKNGFGRGATGSWGCLVRIYHEDEENCWLAADSVGDYLRFEEVTGFSAGWNPTGALYFLKARDLPAIRARLDQLNAALRARSEGPAMALHLLDADEGRRQFPAFQWMEDDVAVWEPHGGTACPYSVTEAFITAATRRGAQARTGQAVAHLGADSVGRVVVQTALGATYVCDQLVLATGIWTPALAKMLGDELPVVPTVLQVNEFVQYGQRLQLPLFIDLENLTFGCPSPRASLFAGHLHDRPSDQDKYVQQLSLLEACDAKRRVALRLPWVKHASLHGGVRGVEGYTPNGRFIVDYSAHHPNVLIATGWNCTGFTLAPLLGRRIASRVAAALGLPA